MGDCCINMPKYDVSAQLNKQHLFEMNFSNLLQLSINRFRYYNMPEGLDERFLELVLLESGKAVLFKDKDGRFLNTNVSGYGNIDVYHNPTRYTAVGVDLNETLELDMENSVIIYDNYLRIVTWDYLGVYARRLTDCDIAINTNVLSQNNPVLAQFPEGQAITAKIFLDKRDAGEPIIPVDENFQLDKGIKLAFTTPPFISDKLQAQKNRIMNEALTFLGINNSNTDKRERLTQGEVNENNGNTLVFRSSGLRARKVGVERFNKLFGTDMGVEWNEEILEKIDDTLLNGVQPSKPGEGDFNVVM